MSARLLTGDCREVMAAEGPFDLIIADPPYGDTALPWDQIVPGWTDAAFRALKPSGSMWVFGSLRLFLAMGRPAGWRYAQDIVWEKANGTGFAADRFKRVHEHAVHFYRADAEWAGVFNEPQREPSSGRKVVVKRRGQTAHTGKIGSAGYEDDGTRLMRSVIDMRSMHGRAIHPTEKPAPLLEILIRTSCPPDGVVGDFFAGSGSCAEAAAITGRSYVGCEIDPEMAAKATGRLGSNLFAASAA